MIVKLRCLPTLPKMVMKRAIAKYSLQEIAKLGVKAQVGLKPTSFVVGNRRLG
ncbi:hypothetical protein [Cylindrospermopsis raciborskii]|uniref:hypothetical protein n=1 Tax=Cylindrospermopsis raciborskii TaxID=77022 RepID=UPI002155CAA4|nr:hypothetical protein [Cylindrospermopsis raciborskii]